MKNISLKLHDEISVATDNILKEMKISRNKYINQAIDYYNGLQKKRLMEIQLKKESKLLSQDSMKVLMEFENIEDGDQEI